MQTVSFIHPYGEMTASYRYRARMPAEEIGASLNRMDADIIVISKPSTIQEGEFIKAQGKKLVVDFCDNHFDHPKLGEIYRGLAKIADACVVPTEKMKEYVPHGTIAVIPDPYEMPELEPHAEGDGILWFGHNAGLKALERVPKLALTIVTGPKIAEGMTLWTPESQEKAMRECSISLHPCLKGHEYKSPNRLLNALRMGLFPICDRHPSYVEFRKFVWASDIRTGMAWRSEFRHELNDMVRAGQDYIRDRYSPKTIGAKWRDFLCSV